MEEYARHRDPQGQRSFLGFCINGRVVRTWGMGERRSEECAGAGGCRGWCCRTLWAVGRSQDFILQRWTDAQPPSYHRATASCFNKLRPAPPQALQPPRLLLAVPLGYQAPLGKLSADRTGCPTHTVDITASSPRFWQVAVTCLEEKASF